MDVVMVPLVMEQAEVGSLLELLGRRERAGLVVHHRQLYGPGRYRLLYVGSLMEAHSDQVKTVDLVPGGHQVLVVDVAIAGSFGLDLVRPQQTWAPYEAMLADHGVEYALVGESSDTAMVVTMHEGQTELLSTTARYRCNGPNGHAFPEPRVALGDPCPRQPECGRPDSTIIRAYR